MKKLLLLLIPFLFTITAYSQNGYSSVFLRVTDSATFVNSANTTAKHAANYADIWYSTASGLFWKWSTVTNTYTMISEGGNFWKNAGTTNLTGDAIVDNGVHNLLIGDLTGPWSSWDIDGSGPIGAANSRADGVGNPSTTDFVYVYQLHEPGLSGMSLIASEDATNGQASIDVIANGTSSYLLFRTMSTDRLRINNTGAWAVNGSTGTSGYHLQSTGSTTPPVWAPDGINNSSALTDGAAITITGVKHTLTSTQATVTWTLSQTQDFQTTDIILNATSTNWTFPAGALCVVDGVASGDNTAALSGVSGDHHIMSIYKDGTNYRVAIKNFGQ